jgi:hypothetical protein
MEPTSIQIIQLVITIILVVITGVYAALTRRIAKSNELAVAAMNSQVENLARPYITVTHNLSARLVVSLSIANTGKSNAENLRLQINEDFFQFGRKEYNLATLPMFQNVVETFPPNSQLVFPLISSLALQNPNSEDPLTPTVFTITATYSFVGKTITEKTTIDLRVYTGIWQQSETVEDKLAELINEFKELKDIVKTKSAN